MFFTFQVVLRIAYIPKTPIKIKIEKHTLYNFRFREEERKTTRVLIQQEDNEGDSPLLRARLQKSREEIVFFSESRKGSDNISSHRKRKPVLQRLLLVLKSWFFRVCLDSHGCLEGFYLEFVFDLLVIGFRFRG